MIIRRISKGIKDQDWFVVMVEVMIVVVGIFIGLQVDDWNEKRKEAIAIQDSYQELIEDFEVNLELSEYSVNYHFEVTKELKYLLLVLRGEVGNDLAKSKILAALSKGDTSFNPSPPSPTYQAILANGRIEKINDPELRRALVSYERFIESNTFSEIRINITEFERDFRQHTDIDLNFKLDREVSEAEFQDIGIANYDLEAMRADVDFVNAVEQLLRMQYYYHLNHMYVLTSAEVVLSLLEPYRNLPPQ
jgi:hypothetical protein